ncbi:MAG: hypothetical protein PHR51_02825 [Patescibacteria group bacterium]|nr:hypothetical protein [Patescibacteria group bacterium]
MQGTNTFQPTSDAQLQHLGTQIAGWMQHGLGLVADVLRLPQELAQRMIESAMTKEGFADEFRRMIADLSARVLEQEVFMLPGLGVGISIRPLSKMFDRRALAFPNKVSVEDISAQIDHCAASSEEPWHFGAVLVNKGVMDELARVYPWLLACFPVIGSGGISGYVPIAANQMENHLASRVGSTLMSPYRLTHETFMDKYGQTHHAFGLTTELAETGSEVWDFLDEFESGRVFVGEGWWVVWISHIMGDDEHHKGWQWTDETLERRR